jgi:hypothetical protein
MIEGLPNHFAVSDVHAGMSVRRDFGISVGFMSSGPMMGHVGNLHVY